MDSQVYFDKMRWMVNTKPDSTKLKSILQFLLLKW